MAQTLVNDAPALPALTPPDAERIAVEHSLGQRAAALLEDLVRIPSQSGDTDRVAARVVTWGRAHGLHAGRTPTGAPWVSTVADPFHIQAQRHILLFGHVDTVPGHIPVRIEDTEDGPVLWGRGSVDAKAPFATFCATLSALSRTAAVARGDVVVTAIGAVDEETDNATALWTRDAFVAPPDHVVIGEPSGHHAVTLGYKGRLLVDVSITLGVAHCGLPEDSAPDSLVAVLDRFRHGVAAEDDTRGAGPGLFERVHHKVRDLSVVSDGLTETATARLDIRLPPEMSHELVLAVLRTDAARPEVTVQDRMDGHLAPRTSVLVRNMVAAIRAEGARPRLLRKTGTSDQCVLAPAWPDAEVATYGPGDAHLDHTPEERIPLNDIHAATGILYRALFGLVQPAAV